MAKENKQLVRVDEKTFNAFVAGRKRTLSIPIPTDLMVVERLPGEGRSAWTVELFLRKGKAYRKCTRLQPFGGYRAFFLACGRRTSPFFAVEKIAVVKGKGEWRWNVSAAPLVR